MKKVNIVLGITGGIAAATKPLDFISRIKYLGKDKGYDINIDTILTPAATHFVTPLSLQTYSKNKVNLDMFEQVDVMKPEHISLADRADLMVIMPATACTIGKIVNGIADNLLTTVIMATTCPIVICPAMNVNMYNNRYNLANIDKLEADPQYTIVGPIVGNLACGVRAVGALAKVDTIIDKVIEIIENLELGETIENE